jgi:plasmid stabilization system protein ParE
MNFAIHELPKAKADKRYIFEWLIERSRRGAEAWLDAYDDILRTLEDRAASFGQALENEEFDFEIKQAFFKTKRGRVYRILFFIEDADVYVLRVRGPGQASVEPSDM